MRAGPRAPAIRLSGGRLCARVAAAAGRAPRGRGRRRADRTRSRRGHPRARRAAAPQAHGRRRQRGCGGFRQGRCRQVHGGRESRARLGRAGRAGRHPRRGHLRPEPAAHAGPWRAPPGDRRRQAHPAARKSRPRRDVDRLPDRCRAADDVARADGDPGAHAIARRYRLGPARLPRRGHAPWNGRHPAHARAARAGGGGRDRDDPAAHRGGRCPQGPQDVRKSLGARARHRREHEPARLLELRARRGHLRCGRRRRNGARARGGAAGPPAARRARARGGRWRPAHGGRGAGHAARRRLSLPGAPHGRGARAARPLASPAVPQIVVEET